MSRIVASGPPSAVILHLSAVVEEMSWQFSRCTGVRHPSRAANPRHAVLAVLGLATRRAFKLWKL